jgi:hypothetical protein
MFNPVTSFIGMVKPSQTMFSESIDNFLSSIERIAKNELGRRALYIGSSNIKIVAMPTGTAAIKGDRINNMIIKMQYAPIIQGA